MYAAGDAALHSGNAGNQVWLGQGTLRKNAEIQYSADDIEPCGHTQPGSGQNALSKTGYRRGRDGAARHIRCLREDSHDNVASYASFQICL